MFTKIVDHNFGNLPKGFNILQFRRKMCTSPLPEQEMRVWRQTNACPEALTAHSIQEKRFCSLLVQKDRNVIIIQIHRVSLARVLMINRLLF